MSDLKSLGYITISTNDVDRWRRFAFGVLGFAEGKGPDESALYAQIDRVAQARADLEKANTHLLLQLRSQMDPDQIKRLEKSR